MQQPVLQQVNPNYERGGTQQSSRILQEFLWTVKKQSPTCANKVQEMSAHLSILVKDTGMPLEVLLLLAYG